MRRIFGQSGLLRRFGADRSGNFAIITGAALSMLALAVGYGVNIAQVYNVRSNLVQSLDSALTSTGRDISTGLIPEDKADESIQAFLQANEGNTLSQGDNFHLQLPIDVDKTAKTIRATAYVDVDVFFPLFGQSNKVRVATTAATLYSDVTVEIGLMLDVTGSMGEKGTPKNGAKQTKLDNLKDAAKDAVDDFLNSNIPGLPPRVRVALIPYSQGVNTGKLSEATYIEGTGLSDIPIGLNVLDLPINKLIKNLLSLLRPVTDTCATERKKDDMSGRAIFDASDRGPGLAMVNRDNRLGRYACPAAPVVPLSTDAAKLKDVIDDFSAGGSTAGHMGIQWTRYMLSPEWATFLQRKADGSAPAKYNIGGVKKVRKIAVLMTDGEFNTAYADKYAGDTSSAGNQVARLRPDALQRDEGGQDRSVHHRVYAERQGRQGHDGEMRHAGYA